MLTLKESILNNSKAGRSSFSIDRVFKDRKKSYYVYSTEEGWEESGGPKSKYLIDNNLDYKRILDHFWNLISTPKERLNKVFTHILNNKSIDTENEGYVWKQEDIDLLNKHFRSLGFKFSFLSVKELKKFARLNKFNLYSYLKIENDKWVGAMTLPVSKNYARFKGISHTIYWQLKEDFKDTQTKWYDKSLPAFENKEFGTQIRFE